MAKVIVVDNQRCLGCRSCMLECAMAHTEAKTLIEAISSDTPPQPRIYIEPVGKFGMPLQCRHCEDAPCMTVCPTEAIQRLSPDSPVLLDADRCIGCRFCMFACPFGIIDLSRDGKAVIKCDMCIQRTEAGELPACVAACPTRALSFVELDDHLRQRRREAAQMLAGGKNTKQALGESDSGCNEG